MIRADIGSAADLTRKSIIGFRNQLVFTAGTVHGGYKQAALKNSSRFLQQRNLARVIQIVLDHSVKHEVNRVRLAGYDL